MTVEQRQLLVTVGGILRWIQVAEPPAGGEWVGLDALRLERWGRALGDRGRAGRRILQAPVPPITRAEELLGGLQLLNGVHRLLGAEPAWARYWLLGLRCAP